MIKAERQEKIVQYSKNPAIIMQTYIKKPLHRLLKTNYAGVFI
jgi:hypothetical protein